MSLEQARQHQLLESECDQPLHALGAVDGKGDVLVRVRIELAGRVLGQQLDIAGYHAQGLL